MAILQSKIHVSTSEMDLHQREMEVAFITDAEGIRGARVMLEPKPENQDAPCVHVLLLFQRLDVPHVHSIPSLGRRWFAPVLLLK